MDCIINIGYIIIFEVLNRVIERMSRNSENDFKLCTLLKSLRKSVMRIKVYTVTLESPCKHEHFDAENGYIL